MGALRARRVAALVALAAQGGAAVLATGRVVAQDSRAATSPAQSGPASRRESVPALVLRGQLVDGGGAALVGVEVTATPAAPATPATPRKAVTDDHGVFTLVGLPAGEVQLRIDHAGSHPSPHPARVRVERGAPDVQIKARALPVLRGVVVDRELRAVGKSEVVLLFPQGPEVVLETDERGAFRAVLAPPKEGLLVVARNAAAGLAGSTVWAGAQEVISVPVAQQSVVTGVVRDAGGKPVAGARVRLVTPKGVRLAAGEADEKGGYRFGLLPAGIEGRVMVGPGAGSLPGPGEAASEDIVTQAGQESKVPVLVVGG